VIRYVLYESAFPGDALGPDVAGDAAGARRAVATGALLVAARG
jgi:hypothetical protein